MRDLHSGRVHVGARSKEVVPVMVPPHLNAKFRTGPNPLISKRQDLNLNLNPKPQTPNPKPRIPNLKTQNPKPAIPMQIP